MKAKKIFYIILGCVSMGIGAVGAALPILPSCPFLLLAAFCFTRSSKKLGNWFKKTKLYKNNLESFVNGEGMSVKTKIRIMATVTILMSVGFYIMYGKGLYIPCIILGGVWVFHILYFCFGVKKYIPREKKNNSLI